jgi:hypothetical protein
MAALKPSSTHARHERPLHFSSEADRDVGAMTADRSRTYRPHPAELDDEACRAPACRGQASGEREQFCRASFWPAPDPGGSQAVPGGVCSVGGRRPRLASPSPDCRSSFTE